MTVDKFVTAETIVTGGAYCDYKDYCDSRDSGEI